MKKLIFTALLLGTSAVTAHSAAAFELTGGEFSLGYSAFTDETDFNALALEGAIELGFSRNFSTQLNLAHYSLGFVDENVTNATVHAIYHANEALSLGAFFGREEIEGESVDFYGIEGGVEFTKYDLEAYIGKSNDLDVDVTVFGIETAYDVNNLFSLGASYDYVDFDGDVSIDRFALKASYAATDSVSIYGELGSFGAEAFGLEGSESFFGIGAEFTFGAERGATFGERGLFHIVPGL